MNIMLNEKDDIGCTPLHYASEKGHMATLEDLVKLGAQLSIRNNSKQAPLHFAAKWAAFHAVLLNSHYIYRLSCHFELMHAFNAMQSN